ncbi:MFS transporter, CP family, cyanate transporter [Neorhodopirellula lusitana]|uniref:MFS transporter, CP family, cyanate transporter n=1 Tax=Neorhodopirellula lusitana TaxID=445327 RepID=A0ABY1QAB2_9BACT|nr:MFS transporter [Neorhodopirellula lusitana]SMP61613.1 MFS transporter, CP family, cyanate transporter [Neorhodopirellula lusitana]
MATVSLQHSLDTESTNIESNRTVEHSASVRASIPDKEVSSTSQSHSKNLLLLCGVLLIALNLRPALASVGPLVEDIRLTTGLSSLQLGLLTTIPLIAFAVISTLTPLFTRRFGIGGTLLGALVMLAAGIGLRSLPSIAGLYFGTVLLGISITFGNVLLPGITKRNFARNSGFVTSLYSSAMTLGAGLAAGLSVPMATDLQLGWRGSLAVWAIPALLALIVWFPQVGRLTKSVPTRSFIKGMQDLGGSRLAWQVALFMGLQSLTFYALLAWLPSILMHRGHDAAFSGWMLSLSQAVGIVGSLIVPTWAGSKSDQRSIVVFLMTIESAGLVGLMIGPAGWVVAWVSLIGFVLGGSFGLALLFIVVRSKDAESATELSGMAQSIGYLIAATGPMIFGSLFDFSGGWSYSLVFLLGVGAVKLVVGMGAGAPRTLG